MVDASIEDDASPDLAVGSFTRWGPWVVEPDAMPWRTDIDGLRARTHERVPALIHRRRLPPLRSVRVGLTFGREGLPWYVKHRKDTEAPEAQGELARRLRPAFEKLGPTYIKLGQVIAAADGMLPAELVDEFKSCRDRVPPETVAHVRSVIEAELGGRLEDHFVDFDPTPIAAASIAQVHAARLVSGEQVVVKVQRPGIEAQVARDLATLAWMAPIVEKRAPQAKLANLPAYVELFAETIVEELDFRLEAQNMLDIARVLAEASERAVVVPRPHPTLVTARVLVMERMQGFAVDNDAAIGAAGIDPTRVFRALMVSLIEGAMIYGVFHGDLHPGNMMVMPDGKACVLDFGITGRFEEKERQAVMGFMMTAVAQDTMAQLEHFRDLGGLPADADLRKLADEMGLEGLMSASSGDMSPEELAEAMRSTMTGLVAHGARMPKSLFLYLKGSVYLNGAIAALAPDLDIFAQMGEVMDYFTSTHADAFKADIGLDFEETPFTGDTITSLMKAQAGVDPETGSMTYRELQAAQNKRMMEMRGSKQKAKRRWRRSRGS